MGVAMQNTGAGVPVDFAGVGIVAHPEHEVGFLLVNVSKYLVTIAVGFSRTVKFRLIDVSTTTESEFESWRIGAKLPERLRLELQWIRPRYLLPIDVQFVGILLSG